MYLQCKWVLPTMTKEERNDLVSVITCLCCWYNWNIWKFATLAPWLTERGSCGHFPPVSVVTLMREHEELWRRMQSPSFQLRRLNVSQNLHGLTEKKVCKHSYSPFSLEPDRCNVRSHRPPRRWLWSSSGLLSGNNQRSFRCLATEKQFDEVNPS